jgi:hypothetical protein
MASSFNFPRAVSSHKKSWKAWEIATLTVCLIVVAVLIIVLPIVLPKNKPATITPHTPQLYPYGQIRMPPNSVTIPFNFSVWGFLFRDSVALAIDGSGNLVLQAKAWNGNAKQRWTCALRDPQNNFNRGVYVIQNIGDSSKCLCSNTNGSSVPTLCSPISTGNFNQQWYMITLSPAANSASDIYALVNRGNNLALAVDPSTMSLFFEPLDGTNPNQQFTLWQLTVN